PELFQWLTAYQARPAELKALDFRPAGVTPNPANRSQRPGIRFDEVGPGEAADRWVSSEEGVAFLSELARQRGQ
ncbi:MAG: hypothetical protein AAF236_13650, partial [Verrucomicrobiota bacterium]